MRWLRWVALAVTLGACAAAAPRPERCEPLNGVRFEASPGGVPEVSTAWVDAHACALRVVDVREASEVAGGAIEDAEAVPLPELAERAAGWDPSAPVVFVCRSGRRSARAVSLVERMGFARAASMTGGMLLWEAEHRPLVRRERESPTRARTSWPPRRTLDADSLVSVLARAQTREVRAAALLLQGTTACVDGREESTVLGTPGGDAGELLLALSTIEAVTGRALREEEIQRVFDHYVDGFGRFYMHTDRHALDRLAEDSRLAEIEDVEALVRHPPAALRESLLEALVEPEHIGCGHLGLVAMHPEEYGVRRELTRSFLRVVFETLWRFPERVDYVVLEGGHTEEAVLNVHVEGPVHAFTNVPAISPRLEGRSFFVNHPEVAAFVRSQHAAFLRQELQGELGSLAGYEEALAARAQQQLSATLGHLGATLPVFDVRLGERVRVEPVR